MRCVLESLALKHAQTLDLLHDATGVELREVHIVGGGARNELLCRWTANASGLPVHAGLVEATEVGNLLVQALALGELGSHRRTRARSSASRSSRRCTSPPRSSCWREARERFEAIAGSPQLLEGIDA